MTRIKGDPNKNKFQVTVTFPTKDLMDEFCSWMSDGGGEQGFMVGEEYGHFDRIIVDYTRCFPAWGWKDGDPKFIDIYFMDDCEWE